MVWKTKLWARLEVVVSLSLLKLLPPKEQGGVALVAGFALLISSPHPTDVASLIVPCAWKIIAQSSS